MGRGRRAFPFANYDDLRAGRPAGAVRARRPRRPGRRLRHLHDGGGRDRPLLRRHRAHLEHAHLLDDVDRRAGRRHPDDRRRSAPSTRAGASCTSAAWCRTARSTRSRSPKAAPPPRAARPSAPRRARSRAAGWSTAARSSPRCRARPTTTACCAPRTRATSSPTRATRCTWRCRPPARASSISGDWNPLGMRGTVSRNLTFKDVFVSDDEQLMPRGVYFKGAQTWPAMFFTLAPTYLGLANAAYDFTVQLPARRGAGRAAGQAPHVPDQADRGGADAHPAGADAQHLPARDPGGAAESVQGRAHAPVRRAVHA